MNTDTVTPPATPTPTKRRKRAEVELQKIQAFIRPPTTEVLGLKVRPYSARSALYLDQVQFPIRQKLKTLAGNSPESEKWLRDMSTYYFLAIYLFLHTHDELELRNLIWKPEEFMVKLEEFLGNFSSTDILSTAGLIAEEMEKIKNFKNYDIKGSEDSPKNA